MNLFNINSYYYSSTVHKQLKTHLNNQGISSMTYTPLVKGYIPREECNYGTENNVIASECFNKFDRYIFHLKHKKILQDIIKLIDFKKFDYSHAHSLFSNGYIALQIKKRYGLPYVVTVRDTDLNTFFKYMPHLRGLGREILNEADTVIFLSPPYRDYLLEEYIPDSLKSKILDKSKIIPSGINDFWLENKGAPKELNNKYNIKLIYVGAINRRKNLTATIKAAEILISKGYNIQFTVVGKIIDKEIYNQFKNLSFVTYFSTKTQEELLDIYRENDIFVMPSITETFGLVYAEAISQGLPVIYTREQGFDGHFEEGQVGYSVDCFDSRDIAEKIILIKDNYESISKYCIESVNKFDWQRISNKYKLVYNNVIQNKDNENVYDQ